ncbi:hypothetical protein HPP92_019307 [Vanilla planifolia]|uniref:Uncharacterized protein n=1 Tax=Vanilla planifolia TaxID=51239 RepID=A0A835UKU6_VANPL|nr:hypothetical protein HPP92_019307 [Vanilla planifolia]
MHRRCRTSQVVNLVHLDEDWLHHIVANQLKPRIPKMVEDVLLPPGEQIIQHDDAVSPFNQSIDKVATNKSCPAGYQNPRSRLFEPHRKSSPRFPASAFAGGGGCNGWREMRD